MLTILVTLSALGPVRTLLGNQPPVPSEIISWTGPFFCSNSMILSDMNGLHVIALPRSKSGPQPDILDGYIYERYERIAI